MALRWREIGQGKIVSAEETKEERDDIFFTDQQQQAMELREVIKTNDGKLWYWLKGPDAQDTETWKLYTTVARMTKLGYESLTVYANNPRINERPIQIIVEIPIADVLKLLAVRIMGG